MSRGLLPGLVVLSGKLAPTLRATTQRTLHSVAQVHLCSTTTKQPAHWRVCCSSSSFRPLPANDLDGVGHQQIY
jgi:hypothetical protein